MVIVSNEPINPDTVSRKIPFSKYAGSVIVHYAVVKPKINECPTKGIRFEATDDVEAEMEMLESNLRRDWNLFDIMLIRRLGTLEVGDVISAVAIAAEGRAAAFGACQEAIKGFKSMSSIGKSELQE